jgi:hypothetical protein
MISDSPEVPIRRFKGGLQLGKLEMQQWWQKAQHVPQQSGKIARVVLQK